MLAVPPAVPHLGAEDRTGRGPAVDRRVAPAPRSPVEPTTAGRGPAVDRRVAPAPRSPVEPTTADRVAADRFADADTDPGWLSATGRPAPRAAAPADPPPAGPLAALFTEAPATGVQVPRPAAPVDEPATEVYAGPPTGEEFRAAAAAPAEYAATWASARHRPDDENDEEDESLLEYEDGSVGPATVFDETGGLEVIVAEEDSVPDGHDDGPGDGGAGGDGRRGGGRGSGRSRRRRGPVTVVLSLVVLAALVVGIVAGGQTLWRTINPIAADYSGSGSGAVQVRVNEGDSLRTIAGTLVESDVIASSKPFEKAAKANPAATGIQPGVYSLHQQMSGKAALDLLLDPVSRVVSKVTLPEGLTVAQTLQRLADQGGLPLDQLQAAAADPAALGLPPYANGLLEGFLFPATYDIEPDDTPVSVLTEMVAGTVRVLDKLQIPEAQRLGVVTEASMVQAEAGSVEDMGKVARVLDNRLADGMPLQLDTTVNYANGKSGLTTTAQDRANPSPYNTYMHPGLPPGAISNPGEEALTAVLNPTPGDWRFFVVVDPDTGETRFAVTAAEHNQNVLLFQQWLQDHPGN
jgi:UPF0755 protein